MLRSLLLYTKYFTRSAFLPARKVVLHDARHYVLNPGAFRKVPACGKVERHKALVLAVSWLLYAQKKMTDNGFGSFHLIEGWSSSYPETTGYIIPTLLNFGKKHDREDAITAALNAANFLIKIQKESGGWQGGRIADNRPEIVFNTAQVIRGMIASFKHTGDKRYYDALLKAAKWVSEIGDPQGYWQKFALLNQARVYDSFVDKPLLDVYRLTGGESFRNTAVRNLEWITNSKMHENGWFEDCDNTMKRNNKPILHTIAYTLDGLIDCGILLGEEKYVNAGRTGADVLRDKFFADSRLNGRYDQEWKGSEYLICTGGAQMAIIWMKLYKYYGEVNYLLSAQKIINLLIFIQDRKDADTRDSKGAIPGSFPIWGRYEPFAFPNWASKFFCDALMMYDEMSS